MTARTPSIASRAIPAVPFFLRRPSGAMLGPAALGRRFALLGGQAASAAVEPERVDP